MSPPKQTKPTAAQLHAQAEALRLKQGVNEHRATLRALQGSRAGVCTAYGWIIDHERIDADFEFDASLVAELSRGPGPWLEPMPAPHVASGPSPLAQYLNGQSPTATPGTPQRFGQELPGAVYGPGNVLANSSAAAAGALQHIGERTGRKALEDGVKAIMARRVTKVTLGPGVELYHAAAKGHWPRVRLRVRGMPLTRVRAMVPTTGGPVTQWRVGGQGTSASLKVQGMTAQQMRNTAIVASEARLPGPLRWSGGTVGGGVLTFAPSAALDAYMSRPACS